MSNAVRVTTIKLPEQEASSTKLRATRGRSGSIVKVEEVGANSVEEVLDRSVAGDKNTEWVNAKGV